MRLSNHFDFSRFWLLLKLELFRSRKGILMALVITFGLLFFVGLVLAIVTDQSLQLYEHHGNYASSLIIGGFILSSLAFSDLGNVLKRYRYLMLPVSALERFLCMWLLTSIGWILLFTITFTLYALVANPVGQLLFRNVTFQAFDPLGGFATSAMKYYFVFQGIFLVGATHFRGYVLPKTLFVLIIFALVSGLIIYFSMKDIFMAEHECTGYDCVLLEEAGLHTVWQVIKWLFWWVLAPLSWAIAWLGLKDQEV